MCSPGIVLVTVPWRPRVRPHVQRGLWRWVQAGSLVLGAWGLLPQVAKAQTPPPLVPNQANPVLPVPPIPESLPTPSLPSPAPPVLPPPDQLLPPATPPANLPGTIPGTTGTVTVSRFEVVGSTVFSEEELATLTQPFLNRPLNFRQLWQVAEVVTQKYRAGGYVTSGAFIPAQQTFAPQGGTVKIQVVEGTLAEIQVSGTGRLHPSYVRRRLERAGRGPLNIDRLVEALQLLQVNPLFKSISAELEQGNRPSTSILRVRAELARALAVEAGVDNFQTPSAGSWRGSLQLRQANLAGQGDGLDVSFVNSQGSNALSFSYTYPINARNGTLNLQVQPQWTQIIEPPFDSLDIRGQSTDIALGFRQPLFQTSRREFAVGLSLARKASQTKLANVPFPLSPGADGDGSTRLNLLRFSQDYLQRSSRQVLAGRSQLTLGLGLGDSSRQPIAPDGRFVAWLGQVQWVRQMAPDTLVLVRTNLQLSNRRLVPLEQLSLTGPETVRGYRQNLLLASNSVTVNAEARIPILRVPKVQGLLQLTPFIDVGHRFDAPSDQPPDQLGNTVAAVGIGLRWQMRRRLFIG
jgi:hemolysin activation/secretion protein